MKKFKIMIVDDVNNQRNLIQSALVRGAADKASQRYLMAKELYEIEDFSIGGLAIARLDCWKPDLALIDLDFSRLTDAIVEKRNKDPKVEISPTRGLDVLKAIREKSPATLPILFTGHRHLVMDYLQNNKMFWANYLVPIYDKDIGLVVLSKKINEVIAQLNEQRIPDLDLEKLEVCTQLKDQELLEEVFSVRGGDYALKHLFAHLATIDADNQVIFEGFREKINELTKRYVQEESQGLQKFSPRGSWKCPHIYRAIEVFRKSDEYHINNRRIDVLAKNLILEVLHHLHNPAYQAQVMYLTTNREDPIYSINPAQFSNIETAFEYGDIPKTNIFHNALILRRAFIGLSEISKRKASRHLFINDVLYFTMKALWKKSTEHNAKHFLSRLLGLSILSTDTPQAINTNRLYLLEEEDHFLQTAVPVIEARFLDELNRDTYTQFDL